MSKKGKIVLTFLISSGVAYVLTIFAIQLKIESATPTGEGAVNDILLATYYVSVGLMAYFLTLNMSSIIGLIVSWRRNDKVAAGAFGLLTLLTLISTAICFLVYD